MEGTLFSRHFDGGSVEATAISAHSIDRSCRVQKCSTNRINRTETSKRYAREQ